jgi:segregation and condensation protein A
MSSSDSAQPELPGTYTGFPVRIEIFEGPLDLLLHLVRRQEVEVAEVQVSQITDEYLRYLETMAAVSIDLAAEFLVVAANLLWLKSRALLPRQEVAAQDELDESDLAETEEELRERLEEYRAYKEAAALLAESHTLRKRVFLRSLAEDDEIGSGYVPLNDVSLFDMIAALQVMLERTREAPPAIVRPAEITVADCIEDICLRLRTCEGHRCDFLDLFDLPTTRTMVVLVFLATLELIRRRELSVSHGEEARQIMVALAIPDAS